MSWKGKWQSAARSSGGQGGGWRTARSTRWPRSTSNAWNTWRGWRRSGSAACPALFAGHRPAWRELPGSARAQLAASPYLLADAGFDDEPRWAGPGAAHGAGRARAVRRSRCSPGPGAGDFIRRVLVFGWHLARANRQLARVVLGMSPACADPHRRACACRIWTGWRSTGRAGCGQRWERQPRVWRHLLLAARDPDRELPDAGRACAACS